MRSVFVSNNGLSDHIGVAQILPYLEGLSGCGYRMEVISVEDPAKAGIYRTAVEPRLRAANIGHFAIERSQSRFLRAVERFIIPGRMQRILSSRMDRNDPAIIHCRSYMPLQAVLKVAQAQNRPFIFDMRGFWIDQRIESGLWNPRKRLYRQLIERFRTLETRGWRAASAIVALTQDAADRIAGEPSYAGTPISVIPCSVDMTVFRYDPAARQTVRAELELAPDDLVLAWLGSAGPVYKVDAAYRLCRQLRDRGVSAKLLMIGDHRTADHAAAARSLGIDLNEGDFRTVKVNHRDVPRYLSAADIGISTIIATPSSLGVSATKTGEYLACGLPVISNSGIGDIGRIVENGRNGYVLNDFSDEELARAVEVIEDPRFDSRADIAARAGDTFAISRAIDSYRAIYEIIDDTGRGA